ncbi:MAG: hypothetical protein IPM53_18125 [Anaerolineaceae bacterium]|nr:hypothetical protein [Anaerolineaceae bacterium]
MGNPIAFASGSSGRRSPDALPRYALDSAEQAPAARAAFASVDSQAWFAWLERITAFCYQPPGTADRFTLRKEKRRQQCYWYAYLKKNRKLHNAYAGKTETLTARRLQQVCATLLVKAARQRQGVGNG